ncbi:MAG: Gfo/Idh/MocA family oxidoreductase, partial [Abditibacteriaceae bacterium]
MEKLRIGVIGAGGIPTAHLPCLKEHDDVELAGVMDVDANRAETFAAEHGFAFHTNNLADLWPRVDAVLVCVPTSFHCDIVVEALNNGKAVFSEKPLTRTLEQADVEKKALDATQ